MSGWYLAFAFGAGIAGGLSLLDGKSIRHVWPLFALSALGLAASVWSGR